MSREVLDACYIPEKPKSSDAYRSGNAAVRHEEEELLEAERSGLAFERGASEAPVSSPTDVALARAVGAFDALGDAQQHLLAP